MSGIYIHIPFCRKACHYCNFHFSTTLKMKGAVLEAMQSELMLQRNYLDDGEPLESIYFGGGTPSLLTLKELENFFNIIYKNFNIKSEIEITLEANPDDLTATYLDDLRQTPINRLSIGIQSFFDNDLTYMNRAHNAKQARSCIENALKKGFKNLTADLIYGSPTTTDEQWAANLDILLAYPLPHLSSYCLTVEERTPLFQFVKEGKSAALDDARALSQFEILIDKTEQANMIHYEISNFGKLDNFAIHNTNYWKGKQYLGIGPAAHSFNGRERRWNIANNALYVKGLEQGFSPFEHEALTEKNKYNEYIMTSLRTIWGVSLEDIETQWGEIRSNNFEQKAKMFLAQGLLIKNENTYTLSRAGKFRADGIASEFFW